MPLENTLLKYLDKTATAEEIREVEQWKSASPKNRKYLQELLTIHFESRHLKNYVDVDVDAEWNHFLSKKSEPLKPIEKSISRRKIFYYAAAACLGFLLCFQVFYNSDAPLKSVASGNKSMIVTLQDASKITLYPNSKLEYQDDFEDLNERRILLYGKAKFDVTSNAAKPFVVETNDFITTVLGTVFTITGSGESKSLAVYKGSVSAAPKNDMDNSIILKKGDRVNFTEDGFSEIKSRHVANPANSKKTEVIKIKKPQPVVQKEKPPVISEKQTKEETPVTPVTPEEIEVKPEVILSKYTLIDVFTFLDKNHVDKNKFSKSRKCKPKKEDTISLNLQEDLEQILERIEEAYEVEYEDPKCDGCFRIKTIKKK